MYKDLKSYQSALLAQDLAVEFVKKYISEKSRTTDQLEQAVRSGKQNIAEACSNSKQKPKSEPFLLGVSSASLKEALEDCKDFLRQHHLKQWDKNDPRVLKIRGLYKTYPSLQEFIRLHQSDWQNRSYQSDRSNKSDKTYQTDTTDQVGGAREATETQWVKLAISVYRPFLRDAESFANTLICLINQTTYLLDNQIKAVEHQMAEKGIGEVGRDGTYRIETHEQKLRRIMRAEQERTRELDEMAKKAAADAAAKMFGKKS